MKTFDFSVIIFCFFGVTIKAQECGIGSASASDLFGQYFGDQSDDDTDATFPNKIYRHVSHIIGGQALKDGAFPWVVYLQISHDDDPNGGCTGTVISPNYILTAKHCTAFPALYSVTVYYGSANRQRMMSQVSKITIQTQGFENVAQDIALIKLESPIEFNENVSSICLSRSLRPKLSDKAIVAGFGLVFHQIIGASPKLGDEVNETNMNADLPNELNAVKVDIIEDEKCTCNCSDPASIALGIQSGTELCAGGLLSGTLEGDSGGPLMILDKDSMKWYQVGITARGQTYATNDSKKVTDHGVYTDVSKFCDWIEASTNMEVICDP